MSHRDGDGRTVVERKAERELVARRAFGAPPRLVFDAWTRPELFQRWWAPKSMGVPMLSCDMDVRPGGGYRIAFGRDHASARSFFGQYLEVSAPARLVWTNEESGEAPVTTVTFQEKDGATLLVLHELYPAAALRDEAFVGMEDVTAEQFAQLDDLLAALGANA